MQMTSLTSMTPPTETSADALSIVYVEDDARLARLTSQYLGSHGLVVAANPLDDRFVTIDPARGWRVRSWLGTRRVRCP